MDYLNFLQPELMCSSESSSSSSSSSVSMLQLSQQNDTQNQLLSQSPASLNIDSSTAILLNNSPRINPAHNQEQNQIESPFVDDSIVESLPSIRHKPRLSNNMDPNL